MPFRPQNEIEGLHHNYRNANFNGAAHPEVNNEVAPTNVMAAYFRRSDVQSYIEALGALSEENEPNVESFLKVFLVYNEDNRITLAMAGANIETSGKIQEAHYVEIPSAGANQGLLADITCPPHCQLSRVDASTGLVVIRNQ